MADSQISEYGVADYLLIGRRQMLRLTRAWGFTAHRKTDRELATFLYRLQQKAKQTKGENLNGAKR